MYSSSELHNMMTNFEHLMNSPAVVKLNKKVSKLKKQVKVLNRVILHLGKSLDVNGDNKANIVDLTEEDEESTSLVCIKTEPVDEECTSLVSIQTEHDDDEYSSSDEEGIHYNIIDDIKACDISSLVSEEEEEEEEVEVEESEDEEEEVEVEVEESEEEVEVEESEDEEEEEEVYEISLNGKSYYTADANQGDIYAITEDEEVGDVVGKFVNGKPVMN